MKQFYKSMAKICLVRGVNPKNEDDATLKDVASFLGGTWKNLLFFCFLGLATSGIYLLFTPNQYQATVRIEILKKPKEGIKNEVTNIEQPLELIQRISSLETFGDSVMSICGFQERLDLFRGDSRTILLSLPQGEGSAINLRVRRQSPDVAKACANAIYQYILKSQIEKRDLILGEYIAQNEQKNQKQIIRINERIAENKLLLGRMYQSRDFNANTYFAILTDARNLENLKESLLENDTFLKLQSLYKIPSPNIYASSLPIMPKIFLSLTLGIIGGLILGILFNIIRHIMSAEGINSENL